MWVYSKYGVLVNLSNAIEVDGIQRGDTFEICATFSEARIIDLGTIKYDRTLLALVMDKIAAQAVIGFINMKVILAEF